MKFFTLLLALAIVAFSTFVVATPTNQRRDGKFMKASPAKNNQKRDSEFIELLPTKKNQKRDSEFIELFPTKKNQKRDGKFSKASPIKNNKKRDSAPASSWKKDGPIGKLTAF